MSYRNKTYIAFDGDSDIRAYYLMRAWKEHDHIDFDFLDAHDINTARDTSSIDSIMAQLRVRMANAKQMVLLVGEKTRTSRKFVPWEIELARYKDIPIIVANLNGKRTYDADRCPLSLGSEVYTMHVSFNARIVQFALDNFAEEYNEYKFKRPGPYKYETSVYEKLGL